MAFKLSIVVLAFIGVASAYVAPLNFISPNQLAPGLSVVQLQHENPSIIPAAAPLVIKNSETFNSTLLPVVQPAAPLIYYNPGLINSAPLAYSAPSLVAHSAPISAPLAYNAPLIVNPEPIASGTYLAHSIFKPIVNVTYAASPIQHISYAAPTSYVISN